MDVNRGVEINLMMSKNVYNNAKCQQHKQPKNCFWGPILHQQFQSILLHHHLFQLGEWLAKLQQIRHWTKSGQWTRESQWQMASLGEMMNLLNIFIDLRESTQRSTFLTHPSTNKWNTQKSGNEPITLTTRPSPQILPFTPIQSSNHRPHSSMASSPKMSQQQTTNWQYNRREEANICERANPCQNNGTCVWDAILRQHICRCAPGFTNENCTERIGENGLNIKIFCSSRFWSLFTRSMPKWGNMCR